MYPTVVQATVLREEGRAQLALWLPFCIHAGL